MNSIKYTIIIPHYNIPNLLRRCLSSIPLNKQIQVIIVDDCSPVNAQKDLENIKKEFTSFEYYTTIKNGGSGKARNIGLSKAKGQYIIFVDADDILCNNAFEIWEQSVNPKSEIIYFLFDCKKEDTLYPSHHMDKRNNSIKRLSKNPKQLEKWLRYTYTEPWGKIFNHYFIKKNSIQFQETIVANDYMFSIKTGLLAKNIEFIEKPFYCYLIRNNSLSNNQLQNKDKILSRLEVYHDVQQIFIKNHIKLRPFDRFLRWLISTQSLDTTEISSIKNKYHLTKSKMIYSYFISSLYTLTQKLFEKLNSPYSGI